MATLINGNGNPRIYAAQDADLIAALAGDITGIAQIGNKFAATAVDANTISVADGVIITKEGRRIQLDAGSTDMFVIPTGTTDVTNYYIIGYKLTTQSDDSQIAETFVQLMSSSSETITEDTFRAGATDVYVSLYRVQQNGVNLGTITGLLPELTNISELRLGLDYKLQGTVEGPTAINYPSTWNEAFISVIFTIDIDIETEYSFHIIEKDVENLGSSNYKFYRNGFGTRNEVNLGDGCILASTETFIVLNTLFHNETDYINSASVTMYYR